MTDERYFALIGEDGYVYPVFFDSENGDKEIDVDIVVDLLNENEQLKQYKQAVSDVLRSWSQKNLTAKQLQVVIAIMEELNILGDVE